MNDEVIYNENIRHLEELTKKLTGPPEEPMKGCIQYKVDNGIAFGFTCLSEKDKISAQKAVMSKGTHFPVHSHVVNEWLIVYEGRMVVHVNGGDKELGIADGIMIPANTPHSVDVIEDTWVLGVSVPPATGYPNDH